MGSVGGRTLSAGRFLNTFHTGEKSMQLSLDELRELSDGRRGKSHSFVLGKCYFIRTVTLYYIGKLDRVTDSDIVLLDASWIADCGRFAESLANGSLLEVEPYPNEAIVARDAIVDAAEWIHPLPRDTK
jgi:hypothetical protein